MAGCDQAFPLQKSIASRYQPGLYREAQLGQPLNFDQNYPILQ